MKSRIAIFLICSGLAVAQSVTTSSTTSGQTVWSFHDTLASMTDVVVADIQTGTRVYRQ